MAAESAVSQRLSGFLSLAEELNGNLRASDAAAARATVARVVAEHDAMQLAVGAAFQEREAKRIKTELCVRAEERQEELVALAKTTQAASTRLGDALQRARDALAATDAAQSSARQGPMATVVEYAERVSYSNAAPCGDIAFEGARRQGWYGGWGAPAPQQHMLANSTFARGRPAAEGGSLPPEAAQEDAPALDPTLGRQESVTFTAVGPRSGAGPAAEPSEHVSLALDSDDEDEFG